MRKPVPEPSELVDACAQLNVIFESHPEQKRVLITNHCLLPLIKLLNARDERTLLAGLHLVVGLAHDKDIFENLCVMGAIPPVMGQCKASQVYRVRLGCAFLIQEIVDNPKTLQMFIACCGLPVLINLIDNSPRGGGVQEAARGLHLVKIGIKLLTSFFRLSRDVYENLR